MLKCFACQPNKQYEARTGRGECGAAPGHAATGRVIGGTYGSGKSTTAKLLHEAPHGLRSVVVDYDLLTGNGQQVDVEQANALRRWAWGGGFLQAVQQEIAAGNDLIIAAGTFYLRERRDSFIAGLRDQATLIPLFFMLPERETIRSLTASRGDETHLVNHVRWRSFYQSFNRAFAQEDHTDLLLPANRHLLAPEYRALLSRREENARVFATPHEDNLRDGHRLVVLPARVEIAALVGVLRERIRQPLVIQELLGYGRLGAEGSQRTPEGRMQPPGQPHGFYR